MYGVTGTPIEDFYQRCGRAKQAQASLRAMQRERNIPEARRVLIMSSREGLAIDLDRTAKALTKIRREIELTHVNSKISPEVKRDRIDQLTVQAISMAEAGIQAFEDAEARAKTRAGK